MKKFILMLTCIFTIFFQLRSNDAPPKQEIARSNWIAEVVVKPRRVVDNKIVYALLYIESHGDDNAKGDKTKTGYYRAIGAMQIHKCYVNEVNNILSSQESDYRFDYQDRLDRKKSILMAKIYLTHFCEKHNRWDYEFIARCHNGGGYGGWKNPKTLKYVDKVSEHLAIRDLRTKHVEKGE